MNQGLEFYRLRKMILKVQFYMEAGNESFAGNLYKKRNES